MKTNPRGYAVPLDRVRHVLGLGDAAVLAVVHRRYADEIADWDRVLTDLDADDRVRPLTMTGALAGLVDGTVDPNYPDSHVYFYAAELLCGTVGDPLEWSDEMDPFGEWVAPLDAVLTGLGAATPVGRLVSGGLPFAVPDGSNGFEPAAGHWTAAEAAANAAAFARADLAAMHPTFADLIRSMAGWAAAVAARGPGWFVVAFAN